MNIDLATVLQTVRMAGSAEPAFRALLDLVKPMLSDADQGELQAIYEREKVASDAAHQQVQEQLAAPSEG